MAPKSKEVAVTEDQATLPTMYDGYEEYAGYGVDDLDASDKSIPFLKVLEKQSPEIETVEGAKPGMFINTATQQLYPSVRFVPATRDHMFVEWVPIENGGGLAASYSMQEKISQWAATQRGKISLKNGNDLVETFYLYGIVLPEEGSDDEPYPAVISFTSTRIKAYKTIANRSDSIMLRGSNGRKFKAPWFCHVWRISSEKKVDGNQSWFVYKAEFDGPSAEAARLPADHEAVQMGVTMVEQKRSGELKVNAEAAAGEQPDTPAYSSGGSAGGSYGGQTSGGAGNYDDDEPPF